MLVYVVHTGLEGLCLYAAENKFDYTLDLLGVLGNNSVPKEWLTKSILNITKNKFKGKTLHIAPFIGNQVVKNFITENMHLFKDIYISDFLGTRVNNDDTVSEYPLYYSWFKNFTQTIMKYDPEKKSLQDVTDAYINYHH